MLTTTGAEQLIGYAAGQVTDHAACLLVCCQHAEPSNELQNTAMQVGRSPNTRRLAKKKKFYTAAEL